MSQGMRNDVQYSMKTQHKEIFQSEVRVSLLKKVTFKVRPEEIGVSQVKGEPPRPREGSLVE